MSVRVNICGYYSQVSIHKLNLLLKNHAGISAISNRTARIRTTKTVEKGKKTISNTQERERTISIVVDLSWTASAWWILTQLYIFVILLLRKKNMFLRHNDFLGVGRWVITHKQWVCCEWVGGTIFIICFFHVLFCSLQSFLISISSIKKVYCK